MDCSGSGLIVAGVGYGSAGIRRNVIQRCAGWGLERSSHVGSVTVERNLFQACGSGGLSISTYDYARVDSNVVGRCGGAGFDVNAGSVQNCTSYLNQGAGFVYRGQAGVSGNVAFGNATYGLVCSGAPHVLGCNDWFANTSGAVSGTSPGSSDVSIDPLFCDLAHDNLHLSAESPLLSLGACGLIGALGQGCLVAVGVAPEQELGIHAFTVSPNPNRGEVQFAWAGAARPEWVDVYDVTGARRWGVAVEPGASTLAWRVTDSAGRRLPAGVYYARLTGRSMSASTRFVLVQ